MSKLNKPSEGKPVNEALNEIRSTFQDVSSYQQASKLCKGLPFNNDVFIEKEHVDLFLEAVSEVFGKLEGLANEADCLSEAQLTRLQEDIKSIVREIYEIKFRKKYFDPSKGDTRGWQGSKPIKPNLRIPEDLAQTVDATFSNTHRLVYGQLPGLEFRLEQTEAKLGLLNLETRIQNYRLACDRCLAKDCAARDPDFPLENVKKG